MNKIGKALIAVLTCVLMIAVTACGKKDAPFEHGLWSGSTYTSGFLKLKIQTDSDWKVFSDAELAINNGISNMSETSIQNVFYNYGCLTEMMASKDGGTTISVAVWSNDKTTNFSEKEFFTNGISTVKAQFEAGGYVCDIQKSDVDLLGKSIDCIELSVPLGSMTRYEIRIPIFVNRYTAILSFSSFDKAETYALLDTVTAI